MEINYIKLAVEKTCNNWDFKKNGKITQLKVQDALGMGIHSIRNNWDKDAVERLNGRIQVQQFIKAFNQSNKTI